MTYINILLKNLKVPDKDKENKILYEKVKTFL